VSALTFITCGVLCYVIGYLAGRVDRDTWRRLMRPTKGKDDE